MLIKCMRYFSEGNPTVQYLINKWKMKFINYVASEIEVAVVRQVNGGSFRRRSLHHDDQFPVVRQLERSKD